VLLGVKTAGAVLVPFRVLSRKKMTEGNVLCKNWYLLEEKKNFKPRPQTGSWYLFRVLFKISDEHPRPFCMGAPRGCQLRVSRAFPELTVFPRLPLVTLFFVF